MKCEKCNEREANFFYTATVNGETAQSHLCLDCAKELGLTKAFERPLFEDFSFFGEPLRMLDGFFSSRPLLDSFFSPRSMFGDMFGELRLPSHSPAPSQTAVAERNAEPSAAKIPQSAGEELRPRRELIALKHQLKAAVRDENFEKAIELRDRIRGLENGN